MLYHVISSCFFYVTLKIESNFILQHIYGLLIHFTIVCPHLSVNFYFGCEEQKFDYQLLWFKRNMDRTSLLSLLMFCLTSSVSASRLELTWDRS